MNKILLTFFIFCTIVVADDNLKKHCLYEVTGETKPIYDAYAELSNIIKSVLFTLPSENFALKKGSKLSDIMKISCNSALNNSENIDFKSKFVYAVKTTVDKNYKEDN